jgi:hypothetical protein
LAEVGAEITTMTALELAGLLTIVARPETVNRTPGSRVTSVMQPIKNT